jgi:hypothetical protein
MKNLCKRLGRGWSQTCAVLLGMGFVTPAFSATLRLPFDMGFSESDYILGGLLLVLIVALPVSITMRHAREERSSEERPTVEARSEGPDLRWWKGHPQT